MKKLFLLLLLVFGFIFTFINGANAYYHAPTWNKTPIQVYISENKTYQANMLHAFQKWQRLSANKIVFKYVNKKEGADIVVNFVDSVDGSDGDIGSYSVNVQGNNIKHAEINIIKNEKKDYTADMMFTTMLHEVGHVLGMTDSDRAVGIMRTPVTSSQDITKRDIIILYKLYGWSTMPSGTYKY